MDTFIDILRVIAEDSPVIAILAIVAFRLERQITLAIQNQQEIIDRLLDAMGK